MLKKFIQARKDSANEAAADAPKINLKSPSAPPLLAPPMVKAAPKDEGNKLIVGPHISLKGSEITDCEILVVEGRVESAMKSRHIRIAQGGVFVGTAEVDVAEIRGCFDGDLIVHKRLVIYATAQIHGHIRYATMQVEEGAVITGTIDMLSLETQSQVDVVPSDLGQLTNFNLFQPTVVHKHQH
ncbi:MAG: polymer-forming cytoskeletal protein [Sulfuriferula sp.]